jgi:hypothetical protein
VTVVVGEAVEDHIAKLTSMDDVSFRIRLLGFEAEKAVVWQWLFPAKIGHSPGRP